jgi:hypothetical protein
MTINILPIGSQISSSFAISASVTLDTNNLPETASFAGYSLGNIGPNGRNFITVSGSVTSL